MIMKYFVLLFVVFFSVGAVAQDNPYAIFGHENKVEYEMDVKEYLYIVNSDTASELYAMIFDVESGLVWFLDERDSIIGQAMIEPNELYRWISVDPLADEYPGMSPYNFCGNNPINNIDPDGRKIKPTNPEAATATSQMLGKYDKNMGYNNPLYQLEITTSNVHGDIIGIKNGYDLKAFQKNAEGMGYDLESEEYKEAENVFNILNTNQVYEVTVLLTNSSSEDIKGYSLLTQNNAINNFTTEYARDDNGEIVNTPGSQYKVDEFLKQGDITGYGYGFFNNSNINSNVSGVLVVNPSEVHCTYTNVPVETRKSSDLIYQGIEKILNP